MISSQSAVIRVRDHLLPWAVQIIVSVAEHHSVIVPMQMLAQRTGATLRHVGLTPDQRVDTEVGCVAIHSRAPSECWFSFHPSALQFQQRVECSASVSQKILLLGYIDSIPTGFDIC